MRGPGLHVEFSVWISCGFIMLSSLLQCGLLMNFTDDLLTGRWIFSSVLCFLTFKWFFFYSGTSLLILKLLAFKNFRWRFLSRLLEIQILWDKSFLFTWLLTFCLNSKRLERQGSPYSSCIDFARRLYLSGYLLSFIKGFTKLPDTNISHRDLWFPRSFQNIF